MPGRVSQSRANVVLPHSKTCGPPFALEPREASSSAVPPHRFGRSQWDSLLDVPDATVESWFSTVIE
jgi:hypothetical protein